MAEPRPAAGGGAGPGEEPAASLVAAADRFRRRALLKKGLASLRDNLWTERHAWRAEIRARCFREYCVLRSTWRRWQAAQRARIKGRQDDTIATRYSDRVRVRKTFQHWRRYVHRRTREGRVSGV